MARVMVGVVCVLVGIVLAFVGQPLLGSDLHPVTTGLIAVGLVCAGVGVAEARLDHHHPHGGPLRRVSSPRR